VERGKISSTVGVREGAGRPGFSGYHTESRSASAVPKGQMVLATGEIGCTDDGGPVIEAVQPQHLLHQRHQFLHRGRLALRGERTRALGAYLLALSSRVGCRGHLTSTVSWACIDLSLRSWSGGGEF
jgi:hypothetical protein